MSDRQIPTAATGSRLLLQTLESARQHTINPRRGATPSAADQVQYCLADACDLFASVVKAKLDDINANLPLSDDRVEYDDVLEKIAAIKSKLVDRMEMLASQLANS